MSKKQFEDLSSRITKIEKLLEENSNLNPLTEKIKNIENYLERFKTLDELTTYLSEVEKQMYMAKEYLTVDETALYLNLSKSQIYKMSHQKDVPSYKPNGKTLYFKRQELDEWIRRHRILSNYEIEQQAEFEANRYCSSTSSNKKR